MLLFTYNDFSCSWQYTIMFNKGGSVHQPSVSMLERVGEGWPPGAAICACALHLISSRHSTVVTTSPNLPPSHTNTRLLFQPSNAFLARFILFFRRFILSDFSFTQTGIFIVQTETVPIVIWNFDLEFSFRF